MSKVKSNIVVLFFLMPTLFFSNCVNPGTAGFFVSAIRIIGKTAADYVLIETIFNLLDSAYGRVFDRAADKTEDAVQSDIRPVSNSEPLLGRKIGDHKYLVEVAAHEKDNTIKIKTEHILFERDNVYSKWKLTSESHDLIVERLEIASVQYALILRNYPTGRMDGIRGRKTSNALKLFQKDQGLPQTGLMDETTKEILLGKQ